jgi:hypothetical protein
MDGSPMKFFAGVFFVSMPLWIVLTIVLVFSPSAGTAQADAIFATLAFGSLLLMVGTLMYEHSKRSASTGAAGPERPAQHQGTPPSPV